MTTKINSLNGKKYEKYKIFGNGSSGGSVSFFLR